MENYKNKVELIKESKINISWLDKFKRKNTILIHKASLNLICDRQVNANCHNALIVPYIINEKHSINIDIFNDVKSNELYIFTRKKRKYRRRKKVLKGAK